MGVGVRRSRGDARGVARGDGRGEERRDARRPGGSSRGGGAGALLRRRRRARRRGGGFQVAGIPSVHGVRGVGDTKIARRVVVSRETRRRRVESIRGGRMGAGRSRPRPSIHPGDVLVAPTTSDTRGGRGRFPRGSRRVGRRAVDLRVGETLGGRDRRVRRGRVTRRARGGEGRRANDAREPRGGGGGAAAVLGAERVQRLAAKFPEDAPGNLGRGSLEKLPSKMDEAKATAISATISAATKATAISAATSSKSRTSMQIPVSTTRGSAFASELASNTRRISGVRFAIVWRRARRRLRSRLPEVSGRIPSTRGTVIAVDSPGTRRMTTSRTSATLAATTTTTSSRCLKNRRRNRSDAAWAGRSATARDGTGTRRARPFRGASARPANAHRTNARRSSLARARRVAFVQTRIFWRTFARAGRRIHASTRFRFSETSHTRNARNSRPFARTPIATRSFASARLLRRSARRSANAPRRRARNARRRTTSFARHQSRSRGRVHGGGERGGGGGRDGGGGGTEEESRATESTAAASRSRGGGGVESAISRRRRRETRRRESSGTAVGSPALEDVVGAALRWSLGYAAAGRDASPSNLSRAQVFSHPPASFASPRAYVEHFAPLLLAELRAQVASAMEESGGKPPGAATRAVVESTAPLRREPTSVGRGNGGHVGNVGDYHHVRVSLARAGVAEDAVQENDLVLLERRDAVGADGSSKTSIDVSSRHALGWVEGVETGGSRGGRDFVSATGGVDATSRSRVPRRAPRIRRRVAHGERRRSAERRG